MMLRYVLLIASILLAGLLPDDPVLAQSSTSRRAVTMPVTFTPNRGQIVDTKGDRRPDVLYSASSGNATVYVRGGAISYVFQQREVPEHDGEAAADGHDHDAEAESTVHLYRLDLELVGARERVEVVEEETAQGLRHFYLGHCPDGIVNVPSFGRVTLKGVYPKIDMVLSGSDGGMKVDFIVHPGGRPSNIRMRYVGSDGVKLDADGGIVATTPLGQLLESKPVSFQRIGGVDKPVTSRFRIDGDVVTFELGRYDASRTLVIDPIRRWSTYYGAQNNELLIGGDPTEVDRRGNAIVTGYVNANTFPVTTGAHQTLYGGGDDAFVVKIDGNGRLKWATYYGGNASEIAHGVVSDTATNVFIAGHTHSTNFPTTPGAHQRTFAGVRDAFVVKFDSNGTCQWGTYYGGTRLDDGYGFAADSSGNVAVVVTSQSSGLHSTGMTAKPSLDGAGANDPPRNDVLIAKFSSTGTRLWATYFGGSAEDFAYAVGSDTSEAIIVTGWTYSTNLPMLNAAQSSNGGNADAFVAKYNKDGTRLWSTYFGGPAKENDDNSGLGFVGVATDLGGNVFVGGVTGGSLPVTTGAAQTTFGGGGRDGYVVKFSSTGAIQWATYFGGNGDDAGTGVAANPDGGVLLTGFTVSNNLPVSPNCIACAPIGMRDVFMARMSSTSTLEFVDYYGGTSNDEGHGISFDPYGSMVVAGVTYSVNFPILSAAQAFKGGNATTNPDAFVMLFCDPSKPRIDSSGPLRFCPGDSVILQGLDGYVEYRWNDLNQTTNRTLVVRETGNYVLWAKSISGCEAYSDTIKVRVHTKIKPRIAPGGPIKLCLPDSVTLDPGPAYVSYTWQPGLETTRTLKVKAAGNYRVITIDANGCKDTSEYVVVTASNKPVMPTISPAGPHVLCDGDPLTLTAAGSPSDTYRWSNGQSGRSITPTTTGKYKVTVTTAAGCTMTSEEVDVTVYPNPKPVIYPQGPTTICEGDSVLLGTTGGYTRYQWSTGATGQTITAKVTGLYKLTVTDDKGCVGDTSIQVTVSKRPTPRVGVLGPLTFCEGDSVELDAGEGYMTYRWSNGQVTRSIAAKLPGRYSVTVYSGPDCPGYSDTVTVNVLPAPHPEMTGPTSVCQNTTATYSAAGGSGRTYAWSVTGTGSSIVSGDGTSSIVVQWGASGTGRVNVRVVDDATGCSSDSVITVNIGSSLVPSINANGPNRLCQGSSVELDAGPGYASYEWSTGATSQKISVDQPGNYTVFVRNAQGCSGRSDTVRVTIAPTPEPSITANGDAALCPGETLTLSTGDFSGYEWSNGERTKSIDVRAPGEYTVTVTDESGCRGVSQTFTVTANEIPRPTVDGPNAICPNASATYCASGAESDQYVWTVTGGTITGGQGTRCIQVQWGAAGAGRVDVSTTLAATGCSGIGEPIDVVISSSLQPAVTAIGSTDLCSGAEVTIEAPSGYTSYVWSNGETARSIKVSQAGTYTVTVVGEGGCTGSGSITVTHREPIRPLLSADGPVTFCQGDSVRISAQPGFVSYEWSTGSTDLSIIVDQAGVYYVRAFDEAGCVGESEAVAVTVNANPEKPVIRREEEILVTTSGPNYQWYLDGVAIPGETGRTHRPTSIGFYTVQVTNESGCVAISEPVEGAGASAVLKVPELTAVPGETVKVPVMLERARNLDAVGADVFTAVLRFNRTVLFPTGATPAGYVLGNERIVPITGSRPAGTADGPLATLEFVAALGDTDATSIIIDSLAWLDATVQTTLEPGSVKITSQGGWRLYLPGGRLSITPPAPNPAMEKVILKYETIEPGINDLALYDVLGRRVLELENRELPPGIYTVEIETQLLAGGTYFIVLVTPTGRVTETLQVAH